MRRAMVIRGHGRSAHDEEPVNASHALDGVHEASASPALTLEMARFFSSGNRSDFEIVDEVLELIGFLFTTRWYRSQIRKERT